MQEICFVIYCLTIKLMTMSIIRKNGGSRSRILSPRTSILTDFFDFDWPAADLAISDRTDTDWIPAANVKEGEKDFSVELSVPGYTRKDIHVEVDNNNVLRITGERKEEKKEEKDNYARREFTYGSFARSFQLPETKNETKIAAKCKEGVLTVELPKKEAAILKKTTKEIEIA